MVKTIKEFRDELRMIRQEMFEEGETADIELVASWLDRVVISLDKISSTLDLMAVEVDVMSRCCGTQSKAKKMKKTKKVKKAKKAKKTRKRRR